VISGPATSNSAAIQLRSSGVGIILGLAAVGYVQAAYTLMGPFMVIFFGMNLVAVPEAARVLRRSPRHLPLFCLLLSGGLALAGLVWGVVLLVALPRGLGHWLLGPIWRPTYPLVLPLTISVVGSCVTAGAGGGLHALGASRRSMRAMLLASAVFLVCGLAGAVAGGAVGTIRGAAVATWIGALLWWWEMRAALQESLIWRRRDARSVLRLRHSRPMNAPGIGLSRSEPTVFGAVRRYRIMVLAVAVVAMIAAIAYAVVSGPTYRATGSLTVALPASQQSQNSAQYLDSEVLLIQSQDVARRAADIANGALGSDRLTTGDFYGNGKSLVIIPPEAAAQGVYGASIINVSFTAPTARIAQAGANAVLQAYDEARSASISAQADATIAGIDNAVASANPAERAALLAQRTQTIANEQTDLANQPTLAWAVEPVDPVSIGWKRAAVVGFVVGLVIGAGLAYARASRRRRFAHRQDPAALYGVPLIGEIPAFEVEKTLRSNGTPAGGLLPMAADPQSAVAEAIRFAAGSVERVRAERGPRLSLVFVSPLAGGGKSTVVANLALAIAEGGTKVLVVDADTAWDGDLTARLLPAHTTASGFEQVLSGQRELADCIQPSTFNGAVAVLGSGPAAQRRVTGAARSKAARALLAEAKATFDVVLVDSPALLQVADATELVDASDAAIIVLSPNDLIRDHLEMLDRLKLIGSDVVGYIYNRAPMSAHLGRYRHNGSSARPMGPLVAPLAGGKSRPSSPPQE
jgi:Mrp family chromosome partitioning ATPase/capsular polysaccharide biosynthesis protein